MCGALGEVEFKKVIQDRVFVCQLLALAFRDFYKCVRSSRMEKALQINDFL